MPLRTLTAASRFVGRRHPEGVLGAVLGVPQDGGPGVLVALVMHALHKLLHHVLRQRGALSAQPPALTCKPSTTWHDNNT